MYTLARLVTDRRGAAFIVAVVVVLTALGAWLARGVRHQDDLMAFLPTDNADIAQFRSINERFGGLEVAIVGVELDAPYTATDLAQLSQLTEAVDRMSGIDHVLSLTNVDDFRPDPMGGIRTAKLIESLPADADALEPIRATVATREHVVGTLVSADGTALALYAFPSFGGDQQAIAQRIGDEARRAFPHQRLHFTGAPFVSSWIYEVTQADMRRLTPWAVGAIILVLLLAFRDLRSVLLGLFSAGAGIIAVQATLALTDTPVNVVLSAMPVILFAIGSAYGIHILARYSAYATQQPLAEAVTQTLIRTGPVVLTAGATTAFGLGSFLLMDQAPLRQFGLFCALGIAVALTLSLTFVPAVIVLLRLAPRPVGAGGIDAACARLGAWLATQRRWVLLAVVPVAAAGVVYTLRVDDRIDQAAFYSEESPPAQADRFMRDRFGGSTFVQLELVGDLRDPNTLRAAQQLADRLSLLPGVHRVQHIGDVVASLSEAMEGQPRLPDNAAKAGLLFGLLTGNPAVRQLVDAELGRALMHVRLSTASLDETEAALAAIEHTVTTQAVTRWRVVPTTEKDGVDARTEMVVDRIRALLNPTGAPPPEAVRAALAIQPKPLAPDDVARRLSLWLQTAESPASISPQHAWLVARALLALPTTHTEADRADAVAGALGAAMDDPRVADLAWAVEVPMQEARRDAEVGAQAAAVLAAVGGPRQPAPDTLAGERLQLLIGAALLDQGLSEIAVSDPHGTQAMAVTVSGTPLLHRGLSASTRQNQTRSLVAALATVALILSVRFRSVHSGLLALAPTGLGLLLIYGGMGLLHVRLDIGTSMLASLIIGAGVDFAVHLMSAWTATEHEPLSHAAARAFARTGAAIGTNAIAVAVGFFVLTLGQARPLQNVGGLTAAGMLVAAACTFLLIPALARRRRYDAHVDPTDPADPLHFGGGAELR